MRKFREKIAARYTLRRGPGGGESEWPKED
jgi:hypothetical protein